MSAEENKALVTRVFEEVFNEGRHELAQDLYSSDCVFHGVPDGYEGRRGPDVVRDLSQVYQDAFPDQRYDIEEILAERDIVSVRWRVSGTHENTLQLGAMSVLKTGRRVNVRGFSMCRIHEGRIAEVWQLADMATAFRQMGAEPGATD